MEEEWEISISSKASSASSGKSEQIKVLNDRLLTESLSRQEAGDLYKRLQQEYETLLAKHAQAENAIDQLRIGARVNLFSDGPNPSQAVESQLIEFKSAPQPILFAKGERALINGPTNWQLPKGLPAEIQPKNNDSVDGEGARKLSNTAEKPKNEKLNVAFRLKDLQDDIGTFQSAIAERELSFEQQRNLYNALKDKHEDLKAEVKRNQERSSKSHGVDPVDRGSSKFLDPSSMEGELYKLELRLGEICDDIGEQLFSGRQDKRGSDELEKALRDDFQRMRTSSKSPEPRIPNVHSTSLAMHRQISSASSEDHSRISRSDIALSDGSHNARSFREQSGSPSPHEKKQPSTEDLAESGYYASESVIKESPRRDSTSVPHRFLTRSVSPDTKRPLNQLKKRHWSLSELQLPVESADEVLIYSSEESEHHAHYPAASRADMNKRLVEVRDERDGGRYEAGDHWYDQSAGPYKQSNHSHGRSPGIASQEEEKSGPAATSSPLEEREGFSNHVVPSGKGTRSAVSSEGTNSRARRSKNSKPASINRASPGWVGRRDSYSDGRKSTRPGSRISKTRPKQLEESSSEESCGNTRPDRVNSSVYSEQDIVPSLVSQPKGNIYGLRHRPQTADSNVDSGFVGSEGTLRSQELLNGGNQRVLSNGKTKQPRPELDRYRESQGEEIPATGLQLNPVNTALKESAAISGDRKHARGLRKSRLPRNERKTDAWDSYSVPDTGSSVLANNSSKLREATRATVTSDDLISIDSRRIPLPAQRLSHHSAESSPLHPLKTADDSYRDNRDDQRDRLKTKRGQQSKRSSFASAEPKLSVIYQEDDSYAGLPISRSRNIRGSSSIDDDRRSSKYVPRSEAVVGRQRRFSNKTEEDYLTTSKLTPVPIAENSYSVEPLREELRRLRNEVAKLSRTQTAAYDQREGPPRQSGRRADEGPKVNDRRNLLYEELKQKVKDINEQFDRPTRSEYGARQDIERSYDRNTDEHSRNYQELKTKLDSLAQEIRRSKEYRPNAPSLSTAPSQQPPASIIPVCPICSGLGYHRHGDYVFPRDVLESGSRVEFVPPRESPVPLAAVNRSPSFVTSTPYAAIKTEHIVHTPPAQTPVHYSTVSPSYRVLPNVPSEMATPMYPVANTIHHIHTFHGKQRSQSSTDDGSDDEDFRRERRRRNKSRSHSRASKKSVDKIDDWRINDSLNVANRAASNMQRISKRMLNTIATDLINSGYSEF